MLNCQLCVKWTPLSVSIWELGPATYGHSGVKWDRQSALYWKTVSWEVTIFTGKIFINVINQIGKLFIHLIESLVVDPAKFSKHSIKGTAIWTRNSVINVEHIILLIRANAILISCTLKMLRFQKYFRKWLILKFFLI